MRLPRRHRVLTALIALFGMLFMQLAVASYACHGLRPGSAEPATAAPADEADMPGCDQPGMSRPLLCHAHCQDGKSTLDKPEARTAAPAAVLIAAIPVASLPVVPELHPRHESASLLQRTTAPPISIRHCCFRI